MKLKLWQTTILAGVFLTSAAYGDVVVSTITATGPGVTGPAWDGATNAAPFGSSFTPTYGQTFVDPAANPLLTGVTFEVNSIVGSQAIPFQAYVYAWSGTAITGPALFTSAIESITPANGFQAITIATPGTVLTPGSSYIAFFSTLGDPTSTGSASFGAMQSPPGDNAYANGNFEFNNSTSFAALSSPTWIAAGDDLAFTLTFAAPVGAVPEPASVFLLITIVGLTGLLARRKLA